MSGFLKRGAHAKLLRELMATVDAQLRDGTLTLKPGATRADMKRFLRDSLGPDDAPPDAPCVDEDEEA